jgi:peptidoglycan/xylan/chitin deacetylase (PgdA/CDA1 family)
MLKHLYDHSSPLVQSSIDRFRYRFGSLPRVNKRGQRQFTCPQGAKAAVVISADFEMAWAWRYSKKSNEPKALALQKADRTRKNLPLLLDLFDRFNVPITWATVGHLFLESCEKTNGRAHSDLPRPPRFENEFWRYAEGDWLDDDPCSDFHQEPAWYAPDLLRSILSTKVKHEIACHTFSHIDCSEDNCPPAIMDSELDQCQRLAENLGVKLRSFVFPANLVGNLTSLKNHGFNAYRWHNGYELDVPGQDRFGLWQVPGGVSWEKPERWPVDAWIKALQRCVDKALETGTVLHLWFHPSCDPVNVEKVFPALLDYLTAHRSDLWIATMGGLVDSLSFPCSTN